MHSWRGALVAVFAAAGVIGAFIPPVRDFFALIIPTGRTAVATAIALCLAALIFFLCLVALPWLFHWAERRLPAGLRRQA